MLETAKILLEENESLFVVGGILLLVIISLVRSGQLHGINRKMTHIMKKIQEYMEAIMDDEEEEEDKSEREELIRYVQKELEKEKSMNAQHKISPEDENVFNTVIKEFFP